MEEEGNVVVRRGAAAKKWLPLLYTLPHMQFDFAEGLLSQNVVVVRPTPSSVWRTSVLPPLGRWRADGCRSWWWRSEEGGEGEGFSPPHCLPVGRRQFLESLV